MSKAAYNKLIAKSQETAKYKEQVSYGVPNGVYCTDLDESYATRSPAACEIINEGKHGQFYVTGRDRTGTLAEGAGSSGLERAGMIDIYVGPGSSAENKNFKFDRKTVLNPSFTTDASRIYITQTTLDIDKAFGLHSSMSGSSSKGKSAIAIKSDHVRLISREKMVFYCGPAHSVNNPGGERNSKDEEILDPPKIELLVGDPSNLEPAVLGGKLRLYLLEREEAHRKLINDIENLNEQLTQINAALAIVTVGSPPFSKNVIDGVINIIENITDSFNSYITEIESLDKSPIKGSKSFLSDSVYVS